MRKNNDVEDHLNKIEKAGIANHYCKMKHFYSGV